MFSSTLSCKVCGLMLIRETPLLSSASSLIKGGLIVIFNRNLGRHVPEEYRREIYARSLYCSHDFDAIGTPYERQLNYHAAHDIGHAMSQYMLVGCSSFAAWGGMSADGELVVGRNFDFYMGDDFARHKIVTFCLSLIHI